MYDYSSPQIFYQVCGSGGRALQARPSRLETLVAKISKWWRPEHKVKRRKPVALTANERVVKMEAQIARLRTQNTRLKARVKLLEQLNHAATTPIIRPEPEERKIISLYK